METSDIDDTKNRLAESDRALKNLNISFWLLFSSFIVIAVLYLESAILRLFDITSHLLGTIIYRLETILLAGSGLLLLIGLIYFTSQLKFFKEFCNIQGSKLPLVILIFSFVTPIYYLLSSFSVRFILLMLYDGTNYTELQDLVLTITTPITYVLTFVLLILIIVMFAKIGENALQKKRLLITAVLLLPFSLVGIFFNHLILYVLEIDGLIDLFMDISIDSTNYWMVAIPNIVLFSLLAGMMLEILFFLKRINEASMIKTDKTF